MKNPKMLAATWLSALIFGGADDVGQDSGALK